MYGHIAGDVVLVSLANILKKNVREVDILGRLGGEEFAVILPEVTLPDAITMAERLRTEIEAVKVSSNDGDISITASFGLATLTEEQVALEELINIADNSLYNAKRHGRNRVEFNQ